MPDNSLLSTSSAHLRNRAVGVIVFLVLAVGCGYFFMYRPVQQGLRTGQFSYSVKGIMLAPLCLYVAVLMMFGLGSRDRMRKPHPEGKGSLTREGWLVVGGFLVVVAITYWLWYAYLHSLGFSTA
jgi:hypothetical protein